MAEYMMPPEIEGFMEACGDVAMDNFDPAAFAADPSAAFADTMGAVMDFMGESGMPPDMMEGFSDIATGVFDQYMGDNPDAAPMEAFDAVGAGIDHHMADMPPDMSCADMAGDFPPPPEDFGAFIDECPPCGSFEGGESYDAAAHPHEGGMADMMDHTDHRRRYGRPETKGTTSRRYGWRSDGRTRTNGWGPGGDQWVNQDQGWWANGIQWGPGPMDGGQVEIQWANQDQWIWTGC